MLISGILPTRGRPELAQQAVRCFLSQTYPDKELVILDDGDEPSFPRSIGAVMVCHNQILSEFHNQIMIEGVPVRYIRTNVTERYSVWEKRNRCCDMARGELIAHFDSDDWSDPERLSRQVEVLEADQKDVVGFNRMLFYETSTGKVAKYVGPESYALGTSLLYRKSFWAMHPYQKPKSGETGSDNAFVRTARDAKQLATRDAGDLMVARLHGGRMNASQRLQNIGTELPFAVLPAGFVAVA